MKKYYFENLKKKMKITIGSIRYRMEIWFIKTHSKYAPNDHGSIATELDHNMVYVAVECLQGMKMTHKKNFNSILSINL